MQIIFVMIGISLTTALFFLGAFCWAVIKGQHDDLHTPAMRILLDDTEAIKNKNSFQKDDPKPCSCLKDCKRCQAIKEWDTNRFPIPTVC